MRRELKEMVTRNFLLSEGRYKGGVTRFSTLTSPFNRSPD